MIYAIVAVLILILDQGMKYFTTTNLPVETGVRELIPGLLQLRHVRNSGSAFSFLNSWPYARWLFLGVTAVFVILVILALSRRWIKGGFGRWMALFVLAGALGNGIDRLLYGYVVDMFEFAFKFPLIGSFPVFDVADVFITCGAIAFCLYILLHKEHSEEANAYGHVRRGPGGSVTTRPAPKPKAKTEPRRAPASKPAEQVSAGTDEPETARAEGGRRVAPRRDAGRREAPQGGRRAAPRGSFTEETKRRPGEDPFAEWMGTSEPRADEKTAAKRDETPGSGRQVTLDIPGAKTEAPKAEPKPVTLDIPGTKAETPKAEARPVTLDIPGIRTEAPKPAAKPVKLDIPASGIDSRENPFRTQSGPVTLDIPGTKAEAPKAEPKPVTLDIPAAKTETPKAGTEPVTLDVPAARSELPKTEAKPVKLDIPAAAETPKPAPKPETIRLDAPDEEEEFTLEDILNEFRDL